MTSAWAWSVACEDRRLVAVDADGQLAVFLGRLQRADAGAAGDREDDVGALGELRQRDFLALGGVAKVPATVLRILTSGLAALAPWSKPTLKSVTVGNSMPTIVGQHAGLGQLGGRVAGEIAGGRGADTARPARWGWRRPRSPALSSKSMNFTSGYSGGQFDDVAGHVEGAGDDDVIAAVGGIGQRRLPLGRGHSPLR